MVEEDKVKFRMTMSGEPLNFCGLNCLYESKPFESIKHSSLSSLILNKTIFEVLALITGLGGVYYTLFETGKIALFMDTISVLAAIAAIIIGIEHLKYVEKHRLVGRTVLLIGFIVISSILLSVWFYGFG
jgi:hypothetical protein